VTIQVHHTVHHRVQQNRSVGLFNGRQRSVHKGQNELKITIIKRDTVVVLMIISLTIFGISCGSNDESSAPANDVDAVTATTVPPTQDPIIGSGLEVGEVTVDGGQFGGNVLVEVSNISAIACAGLVINFDLLTENGTLVGQIGAIGSPLAAGAEQSVKTRFIGAGVTDAKISAITCDNSSLGDSGAPARAQTAVPSK